MNVTEMSENVRSRSRIHLIALYAAGRAYFASQRSTEITENRRKEEGAAGPD